MYKTQAPGIPINGNNPSTAIPAAINTIFNMNGTYVTFVVKILNCKS